MFTILLTKKIKMKKIFLLVSPLLFLVACSSGDGSSSNSVDPPNPEISGCMDDCAVNYNADATTGVGAVCLYDFLGTYSISNYKQDGISLFNADYWVDPLVAGAIYFGVTNSGVGVYESLYQYASGQQTGGTGTFTNNTTQLLLYPDEGGSQLWTTTKINCLEFDGESTVGGYFYEIELDFYSAKLDGSERNPNISKFDVTKFTKK